MKIPLICPFGEYTECNKRSLPLMGVTWFKWSWGMDYTYFFPTNETWNSCDFISSYETERPYHITIPDELLSDTFIKDRGFPLRGKGYANGVYYINGQYYINFLMTGNYYEHIKVQCDEKSIYIPGGNIIFPTGWDDEKKEKAVLKRYNIAKKKEEGGML